MYIQRNIEARSCNQLQWKSNEYYIFQVCLCSLTYRACNTCVPYGHIKLLNTKRVFWFSLQILSATFLILGRTERDTIRTVYRSYVGGCYCCQASMELQLLPQVFEEYWSFQFNENPASGSRVVLYGRTDMTKRIVAFRNFANAPKIPPFCPQSVLMCFVWIWEQTAIISLYSINWLVCITETECVYCAVRTGSLYIIQFNFRVASVNRFSTLFRWLDDDDKFRGRWPRRRRRPAAAAPTLYNFSSGKNRKCLGKKVDLLTKQTELLHLMKSVITAVCGRLVFTFLQILNQILCNVSDRNKRCKGKGLKIEEFHCSCLKQIMFMFM